MYFMPKLGVLINDRPLVRREVWHSLGRATLVTLLCAIGIMITREWIVRLVLTRSFLPVVELLPWQLAADVVTMAAWILSMTLTALMRSAAYIFCEVARSVVFVAMAAWLMADHGVVAANWAYFASSAVHLVFAAFALRDVLWSTKSFTRKA
jgi:PST family polysaccharide transporter